MKISIVSDLHLEFCYNKNIMPKLDNVDNAETLVLAGDIFPPAHFNPKVDFIAEVRAFLLDLKSKWKHVLAIAGNHEYYGWNIQEAGQYLKKFYNELGIVFLDDSVKDIEGVRFIGSTLWTDMNKGSALAQSNAKSMLYDFSCITNGPGKRLSPYDTTVFHRNSAAFIRAMREPGCVVITHHLPSWGSVSQRFRNPLDLTNYCFYSDLDDMILDSGIKLWIHGHTHDACDYMLGDTRVVCNPLGYPGENGRAYGPVTVEI
ncbi:Calcineurin-like phosphoesterase domain, ApaH type [uncultured Caudovirales phage]|uniref:Calcineurin-like phosphoesterase domain, ApaH type n=1 Tax=uncultured Caudovirales phage TaxID=2100421 RepID=A0A6J5LNB0_9CAUD|nr:Calcineurin-like phosphoesterase domain, ApaH type [uncultured Caudovirales phage]